MAGIAGIASSGKSIQVEHMLDRISHRGPAGRAVMEFDGATLGILWPKSQVNLADALQQKGMVQDGAADGHYASARITEGRLVLERDPLGVAPLYYGWSRDKTLCFASEVKALLPVTEVIHEMPPGHRYAGEHMESWFQLRKQEPSCETPENMARELNGLLATSVERRIEGDEFGSWLSGGLDSSAMAALARRHVKTLHTFVAGHPGAPDLEYAGEVARYIGSSHHELIATVDDMITVLPQVIYALESFDALLVRSSITNYLVARLASDFVSDVFSGEGGDELFAGYEYLRSLDPSLLPDELIDITGRLHNTALQRVDRCASAHGTVAHVGFLDPEVVDFALRIPVQYKLHDGIEKWILRKAMAGFLPDNVLDRRKAKFWEGAGVGESLAQHAQEQISDTDFRKERTLPNGWIINTKEELMYYRIFRDQFGDMEDLSWMGRTKGAPSV